MVGASCLSDRDGTQSRIRTREQDQGGYVDPLKIGQLAASAGVGVETIRYYQRRKLLGTPPKPYGSQRLYPAEYVDRLRFIKRAQALGFSLDDVAVLLQLNDGTGHARARALAAKRLAAVEAKIADL